MAYNKLSTYRTKISAVAGVLYNVQYHATTIVQCYEDSGRRVIELNTGGYRTVTTKRKMNQAAWQFALGYTVHQHKHEWFVTTKAGVFPFDDRVFVIDVDTGLPYADALAYVADMDARADAAADEAAMQDEWNAACAERDADYLDARYDAWKDARAEREANREYDDGGMAYERARHP